MVAAVFSSKVFHLKSPGRVPVGDLLQFLRKLRTFFRHRCGISNGAIK